MIAFLAAAMQFRIWSSYGDNLRAGAHNAIELHDASLFAWDLMAEFGEAFQAAY